MDFYCRLLLEKLDIPKNQWNKYLRTAQTINIQIDPGCKYAAFLGVPAPMHEGTFLSVNLLHQLTALELRPQAQAYSCGMICLKTEDNQHVDIIEIDAYIHTRIEQIIEDQVSTDWIAQLILAAKLIQLLLHEHLYLQNQMINLELLIKEQDRLLAQVACFFLPPSFLKDIRNPVNFLEQIAPKLGRYTIHEYKESI